jgi:hypothetical protein
MKELLCFGYGSNELKRWAPSHPHTLDHIELCKFRLHSSSLYSIGINIKTNIYELIYTLKLFVAK